MKYAVSTPLNSLNSFKLRITRKDWEFFTGQEHQGDMITKNNVFWIRCWKIIEIRKIILIEKWIEINPFMLKIEIIEFLHESYVCYLEKLKD